MSNHAYSGILRDEMAGFLEMRKNQGFKDSHKFILASLDKYLVSQNITAKMLTATIIDN